MSESCFPGSDPGRRFDLLPDVCDQSRLAEAVGERTDRAHAHDGYRIDPSSRHFGDTADEPVRETEDTPAPIATQRCPHDRSARRSGTTAPCARSRRRGRAGYAPCPRRYMEPAGMIEGSRVGIHRMPGGSNRRCPDGPTLRNQTEANGTSKCPAPIPGPPAMCAFAQPFPKTHVMMVPCVQASLVT